MSDDDQAVETPRIDTFFAMLCIETGLDESATIKEMKEALKERGWTVRRDYHDYPRK